jgi:hypothetical protein
MNPANIICLRLAWKRPKIVCSPSYADIRSRANTQGDWTLITR